MKKLLIFLMLIGFASFGQQDCGISDKIVNPERCGRPSKAEIEGIFAKIHLWDKEEEITREKLINHTDTAGTSFTHHLARSKSVYLMPNRAAVKEVNQELSTALGFTMGMYAESDVVGKKDMFDKFMLRLTSFLNELRYNPTGQYEKPYLNNFDLVLTAKFMLAKKAYTAQVTIADKTLDISDDTKTQWEELLNKGISEKGTPKTYTDYYDLENALLEALKNWKETVKKEGIGKVVQDRSEYAMLDPYIEFLGGTKSSYNKSELCKEFWFLTKNTQLIEIKEFEEGDQFEFIPNTKQLVKITRANKTYSYASFYNVKDVKTNKDVNNEVNKLPSSAFICFSCIDDAITNLKAKSISKKSYKIGGKEHSFYSGDFEPYLIKVGKAFPCEVGKMVACPDISGNLKCCQLTSKDCQQQGGCFGENNIETTINQLKLAIVGCQPNLNNLVKDVCYEVLAALTYQEKVAAVTCLSKVNYSNNSNEYAINRLVKAIKATEAKAFIAELEKNNSALLKSMLNATSDAILGIAGNDNYLELVKEFTSLVMRSEDISLRAIELSKKDRIIKWGRQGLQLKRFGKFNFNTGKVELKEKRYGINMAGLQQINIDDVDLNLSPFELVQFSSYDGIDLINSATGVAKGEAVIVPAIFLEYVHQKKNNEDFGVALMVGFDLFTIASSGGTLAMATKLSWLRKIWLGTEVAMASANIIVNTNMLPKEGKIGQAVLGYNIGMGMLGIYNLAKGGVNILKQLNKTEELNNLRKDLIEKSLQPVVQANDELKALGNNEEAAKLLKFEETLKKELKVTEQELANLKVAGRFIAKTGEELKDYLNNLRDLPKGISYEGKMYRNIGSAYNDPTYIVRNANSDANNRFITGLYLSEEKSGNIFEAIHYTGGTTGRDLYEFSNVKINNLLDLSNEQNLEKLGTSLKQMMLESDDKLAQYEFTNVVAKWAKEKGYSGIKFKGARGKGTDYINFVIFEESTVSKWLNNYKKIEW